MKSSENKKKKSPIEILIGKETVFQLYGGIIIEGTFGGEFGNFYVVSSAKITGTKHICRTQYCLIRKDRISHLHLKGEVSEIEEGR